MKPVLTGGSSAQCVLALALHVLLMISHSPDWMGSILNFLSPLQKEVVMCLSIFRGRLSMAFPMLVSLLTGFINNNAENLGVFQLPSEER